SPSSTSSSSASSCPSSGLSDDRSSYSSLDQEDDTLTRRQQVHHNQFSHREARLPSSNSSSHQNQVMRGVSEDSAVKADHLMMRRTCIARSEEHTSELQSRGHL